jgi:hypothetical protein
MNSSIVPIVEGQSEEISVPILLRRVLHEILEVWDVEVAKPFRVKRNRVVKEGELERAIEQAGRRGDNPGAILVLLDTDPDDCPVNIAASLRERAANATGLPIAVVMANLEFEAWLLGSKESLRGHCGIRVDATAPNNPEGIRGAKGQLSRNMGQGRRYIETVDQPALCAKIDIASCRQRCPSFRKLLKDVEYLVKEMKKS